MKSLDDFPKNAAKKDGHAAICKACQREYVKNHYKNNTQYYVDKAARQKERIKEELKMLKDRPCADCQESYPYYVMDFDHLNDKDFTICGSTKGIKKILAEAAKCEVVCSNCHRIRTHNRRQAG